MHAKNIRYLFHDRNLNDFLDGKTGALLATADAWAVASPATSAYATQTNSTIPVINIEENTFIATLKARKQFAKTMCLVRNKRILTICDEFNLNLCTYNILNRGFKVRELTNVPFSYYGQDFIGYVFAIQQNDEYHPSKALDMAKTAATGPLPHEAFNAEISLKTSKIDTKRDRLFSIPISIRNASAYVWPSLKSSGGMDRVVAISYHITDSDNNMVVSDGIRSLLLYDVKPGQRIDQNEIVRSPEQPGRYIVEIDMIQQGVAWFANKRKSPVKCRINVF